MSQYILCMHIFPFQWLWIRKLLYCYWATVLQSNTRPLEVQTAKVQVPCWAVVGQSSLFITPSLRLSLSLPPWWLMANAALVHLYIPPHPSLTNRCEILDMAWIWHRGEKWGWGVVWLDCHFHLPQHLYIFCSFFSCKQTAFWDCPQLIIDIICCIFKLENNRCSCFLERWSLVVMQIIEKMKER